MRRLEAKRKQHFGAFLFFVVFVKTVSVVLGSVMLKYRVIIWYHSDL
jgi:hypothetical protein